MTGRLDTNRHTTSPPAPFTDQPKLSSHQSPNHTRHSHRCGACGATFGSWTTAATRWTPRPSPRWVGGEGGEEVQLIGWWVDSKELPSCVCLHACMLVHMYVNK